MIFSKTIKKLFLTVFLFFSFFLLAGSLFPKSSQAMILREKSLRESFFTQLIDEISLKPKQSISQSIRLNYKNPMGIEILFRNPLEQMVQGVFKLKDNSGKILKESLFSIKPQSPAAFHFFDFPQLENNKEGEFWLEITNIGFAPLILGYYNQNVYHYGQLFLEKNLQSGVLQFQIHYRINLLKEFWFKLINSLKHEWLFFSIWMIIVVSTTLKVFFLAKNYRRTKKKV